MSQNRPAGAPFDPYRQGLEAMASQNYSAAVVHFQQAAAFRPDDFEANRLLAHALREQGDLPAAVRTYEKALGLRPGHAETHLLLADALRRLAQPGEALPHCDAAIARSYRLDEAWLTRSIIRHDLGDKAGAAHDAEMSLRYADTPVAHRICGVLLSQLGRPADALPHLRKAADADPKSAEIRNLLGNCYNVLGDIREAIKTYLEVTHIDPGGSEAFTNLCGLLCHTGQFDMAVSAGEIAIRLAPEDAEARYNLAAAYEVAKRRPEAIAQCVEALRRKPDFARALYFMCVLMRQDCVWDGLEEAEAAACQAAVWGDPPTPVSPFGLLSMSDRPEDALACGRTYGASLTRNTAAPLASYAPRPESRRGARIRIGYLSSDFYDHATAILMVEALERHDRTRFEIFGYSIGYSDDRPITSRVRRALDHFVDLNAYSHAEAAQRIRQDEIDILIDLKGYTYQARPEILSYRPAPIQVNYLGYPATIGVPFIDYAIVDRIIAPPEHAPYFAEKLVHLPHAYQPNDRTRFVPRERPPRSAYGLPDEGFVFCCFNANNKIGPTIFDIWMRLLAAVPGSVLWLLASNERAPGNLQREAIKRGIDPGRLVFAPRALMEDHLIRVGHADLFLDTHPYGAHTTASEMLWCGVPVLTMLGRSFQARVAASLLTAAGLPELVTPDLAAYEALALRLAQSPAEVARLKTKLDETRMSVPLFDTELFLAGYEAALQRMNDIRDAGEPPQTFAL